MCVRERERERERECWVRDEGKDTNLVGLAMTRGGEWWQLGGKFFLWDPMSHYYGGLLDSWQLTGFRHVGLY